MQKAIAAAILVVALDQVIRWLLIRRASGLGKLGVAPGISSQPLLLRHFPLSQNALECGWVAATVVLLLAVWSLPALGGWAGLVIGGSFSHLLERRNHGSVRDYWRLPSLTVAFTLADVCLLIGAIGCVGQICRWFVAGQARVAWLQITSIF